MSGLLEEFARFRESLVNDVVKIERVLADLETQYHTAEYSQAGSVLKGFDGFLASKENLRKRARNYKPDDRLFSMSSRSSPALRDGLDGGSLDADGMQKRMLGGTFGQKGYAQKGYASKQIKR